MQCDICYFSSTRYSKPPRYFRMKNNKSFILISLCQTVKTVFLCWTYKSLCNTLVIHGASHFTKLFIVTFCPSDKLLCKILCCDFLSYMFCQNTKLKLTFCPVTFRPWYFVCDFLSCDFLSYIQEIYIISRECHIIYPVW